MPKIKLPRSRTWTETVNWHNAKTEMPDSELTVLVHCPREDDPVWIGFYDGETWRNAEGRLIDVDVWANLPIGEDSTR